MALAEKLHHSANRSVPLKEELAEHEKHNAPRGQKTASGRGTDFFDVFDEELGGGRPQARVLRRTVEPIIESFVPLPMIDAPVPQMVDQSAEVVRFFASLPVVAEQVIEVPTIILEDPIPQRALLRAPQLAEQLVEVPTILYFLKQRISEQIDDNPVPHGGRGASGGLQGFLPGHSSLNGLRTRLLTFQLRAVVSGVFKVFSQNRVQLRLLLRLWNAFLSGMWSR